MRNAAASPGLAMADCISLRNSDDTRSSASSDSTQSPVARPRARFFCGPKPGQSITRTFAPNSLQIATVLSVLPESTTMISFAQETDCRQARIICSSFLVMMMTERLMLWGCYFANSISIRRKVVRSSTHKAFLRCGLEAES